MKYQAAICPSCGATLEVPASQNTLKCKYCGVQVILQEDVRDGIADRTLLETKKEEKVEETNSQLSKEKLVKEPIAPIPENFPLGEERKVEFLGGATIDGAPLSYMVVLAAVVVALSFFPMSAIIAIGGSFPMSQGVLGLVGWVLGPIAGAISSGIGALIGIFLAPHTAGIPFIRIWGSVITSFAAGTMVLGIKRKGWWFWVWVYALLSFLYFIGRAIFINGVGFWPAIANSFVDWSALILFALPTRTLFAQWINSEKLGLVVAGLGLGTWTVFGLTHACLAAITYHMFNWTEEVFIMLIPLIPFENLMRSIIGMVIGGGVIAGLRAIGLVKPEKAIY